MLFNSLHFLIFFTIVTSLYFVLPYNRRWLLLLISSCYFYMAFVPIYIFILGFTIVIDYFAGIYIENAEGRRRKLFLIFSLVANIGVLAIFKYYNFLNHNLSLLLGGFGLTNSIPYLSILLPIGLSFHTFQAMSYTVEVYRGNQKAERHFGIYALYVMFYPQLVAGPIERPQNLLHQFKSKYDFDYDRVTEGLRRMAWGLFKKIVIVDRLALVVDTVYNNPQEHNAVSLIIATYFFAFQLYCDFSGYTDIALGAAKVMGFTLMENFQHPYFAKNISEFWKRWHISLTSWFNDYLYTPFVVANRDWGKLSIVLGLMLTFMTSGLWHGANWTCVCYGLIHGTGFVFFVLTTKLRNKIFGLFPRRFADAISIMLTFSFVCISYVFFRANSVGDAFYIVTHTITGIPDLTNQLKLLSNSSAFESLEFEMNKLGISNVVLSLLLVLFLGAVEVIQSKKNISEIFNRQPTYIRWSIYYGFILAIFFLGVFGNRQFIYFQF
jgi:alginate O-acetyltransferase complex protein AlgI